MSHDFSRHRAQRWESCGIATDFMWEMVWVSYDNSFTTRWLWSTILAKQTMKISMKEPYLHKQRHHDHRCHPKQEITTLKTCWNHPITKPACSHHSSHKKIHNKSHKPSTFIMFLLETPFYTLKVNIPRVPKVPCEDDKPFPERTPNPSSIASEKKQEKHIIFFVKVWETKMRRTKKPICGKKHLAIWKDVSGPMRDRSVEFWHLFWFCLFEKIKRVHFGTFHRAGWGDQVTNCSSILWN